MEKFCLSCGSANHYKSTNCLSCNFSFEDIKIELPKQIARADQIQSDKHFVPKLGDKFDFSVFESMAADLEKEITGHGDEKDLGKWGAKTIDGLELFKDIISKQNK